MTRNGTNLQRRPPKRLTAPYLERSAAAAAAAANTFSQDKTSACRQLQPWGLAFGETLPTPKDRFCSRRGCKAALPVPWLPPVAAPLGPHTTRPSLAQVYARLWEQRCQEATRGASKAKATQ